MRRTAMLLALGLALLASAIGCDKKAEDRKEDLPMTGSGGVDAKGKKSKAMEAGVNYPPQP